MRSEGYCTWFVCVSVCVCLMPYFSNTVSLHMARKVPMASARHCADYYKKGFRDRHFIQKLWRHLLTRGVLRGYCSVIPRTFSTAEPSKYPKKANNRLNTTWNTTRCKAASFFLFSLRLLPKIVRILPVIRMRCNSVCTLHFMRRGFCTLVH